MMPITEVQVPDTEASSPPWVKTRMLTQMAEALEDQVSALYRRAAAYEEEEFLLNREIEERQTEVSRLLLKLQAMRAERGRVVEKIESISREATALREEVVNDEEEAALGSIESPKAETPTGPEGEGDLPAPTGSVPGRSTTFFRRMTLSAEMPDS